MNHSDTIKELAGALIAAQKELPHIVKDKTARTEKFSYDYVGLDTVMPAALKVLNKYGLGVMQPVGNGGHDGGATVTTVLFHESGEWIADTQPLILSKHDSQGQGSAITYARRYGLMSMIGMVADDDDDGAAASVGRTQSPASEYQEYHNQAAERAPGAAGGQPAAAKKSETKYDGKCFVCGEPYHTGEMVYYKQVEGKWVRWHEACNAE